MEMNGTREAVDRAHAESLADLRAHARDAVFLLYDAYDGATDADERFKAVVTLSRLESPFATEALVDIARRTVPERSLVDPHHDTERDTALMERVVALDGLAALAAFEDDAAAQALYAMAVDPKNDGQPAVKIAAIRGFIGNGPGWEQRAAALADHVPAGLHWTLSPRAPRAPRDRATMKSALAQNPMPLPP